MPTLGERVIYAPGETGSKAAVDTDFGGLSGLICGENGNPLAQYSLSLDYPVVHVASWPAHFCPGAEIQDAAQTITMGLANSLCCYVINSVALVDDDVIKTYGQDPAVQEFLEKEKAKRRSTIVGSGRVIAGPFKETPEGVLYAKVSVDGLIKSKYSLDYAGHYNRPELFAHHFRRFFKV